MEKKIHDDMVFFLLLFLLSVNEMMPRGPPFFMKKLEKMLKLVEGTDEGWRWKGAKWNATADSFPDVIKIQIWVFSFFRFWPK